MTTMGLRLGFGVGPLRASVPLLPRGRRSRSSSSGSGCGVVLALTLLFFVGAWPYLLLEKHHHAAAVTAVSAWLALLALIFILVAASRARERSAHQEQAYARRAELAAHRSRIAATNTPWLDPEARAYMHSTCTIRHKTQGAAQRCKGRV